MSKNADILQKGFARYYERIVQTLTDSLVEAAYELLVKAESNKEYHNLTGNTLTSYMVGIYVSGRLSKIVTMYDAADIERPKRGKLYRGSGKGVVYVEDYDSGRWVHVRKSNLIDTDKDYGENTSRRFLQSYKANKNHIGLVMCTGTEYSEFLEHVKRLDVLTNTFYEAERIINGKWKKIE